MATFDFLDINRWEDEGGFVVPENPQVNAIEIYASVILHSGCAIPPINETESRLHTWAECREQRFFRRVARKHQHKLQSNGIAIGPVPQLA